MFDHKDIVIMSYDDNLQLMEHSVFVYQLWFLCELDIIQMCYYFLWQV